MNKTSRKQRLGAIVAELNALSHEYEAWLERLPDNLAQSKLAEHLEETIESLKEGTEVLENIQVPLGFGR